MTNGENAGPAPPRKPNQQVIAHAASPRNPLQARTERLEFGSDDIQQSRQVFDVASRCFDLHPTTQTGEDRLRFDWLRSFRHVLPRTVRRCVSGISPAAVTG